MPFKNGSREWPRFQWMTLVKSQMSVSVCSGDELAASNIHVLTFAGVVELVCFFTKLHCEDSSDN